MTPQVERFIAYYGGRTRPRSSPSPGSGTDRRLTLDLNREAAVVGGERNMVGEPPLLVDTLGDAVPGGVEIEVLETDVRGPTRASTSPRTEFCAIFTDLIGS
jgi:hypothetical protein